MERLNKDSLSAGWTRLTRCVKIEIYKIESGVVDMDYGMTRSQRIFCDEYLIDLNATRAYKVAYKSVKKDETARANASRLLTKANIKAYIDQKVDEMSSKRIADATEVMEYLTSVLRGKEQEQTLIGLGQGLQDITDINVSAKDKIKAAELLGKRYALFTDKVDVEGEIGLNLVIDYGDSD